MKRRAYKHLRVHTLATVATVATVAALAVGATHVAHAAYPDKPVTLVVGYGAGGPADFMARTVAQGLSDMWQQSVIVENKPGATTTIATAQVARAKPDGYTLLLAANDYPTSKFTYQNLSYEVGKSFVAIAMVSHTPNTLMVAKGSPARTLDDILNMVREKPNGYTYSSTGVGSTSHVAAELFKRRTQTEIMHVPYNGVSKALPDILSGRIDMVFPSLSSFKSQIESGNLIPIAQATETRTKLLPDVPTFKELGVEDYAVSTWYGIIAPAGMDEALVEKLNQDVNAVLTRPEVQQALLRGGSEAMPISAQAFAAIIERDIATMGSLAEQLGLGKQ